MDGDDSRPRGAEHLALASQASVRRLRELVQDLAAREPWALLVGAGLSQAAGLPGWRALVEHLASCFGVPLHDLDNTDPDTYPAIIEDCLSSAPTAAHFWAEVESQLAGCEPTENHRLLVSIPFNLFVTTNYDRLLEVAHRDAPNVAQPASMTYPFLRITEMSGRRLVYLHGRLDVKDDYEDGESDPIVLTQSSYIRAYAYDGILERAIRQLFAEYRVLFVGTSLDDVPIRYHLLASLRRFDTERGRQGFRIDDERHYALVASPTPFENDQHADRQWAGSAYGVKPIYYLLDDGGGYENLDRIIEWLNRTAGTASTIAGDTP